MYRSGEEPSSLHRMGLCWGGKYLEKEREAGSKPSSVTAVTIYLRHALPSTCSGLPDGQARRAASSHPTWPCSERGYLAGRVASAAGELLPHPFTLTLSGGLVSVALPRDRSRWALPTALPCGARTFLRGPGNSVPRGHLATLLRAARPERNQIVCQKGGQPPAQACLRVCSVRAVCN